MSKEDMELYEMFHGEEKPLHPDTVHETFIKPTGGAEKKATANTTRTEKAAQEPAKKSTKANEAAKDAPWEPVKPDPNWLDNLKACAKWTAIFGGLCVLFFYWQQTGQMAASAAVPSMCVCCGLAGLSIGMNVVRGES